MNFAKLVTIISCIYELVCCRMIMEVSSSRRIKDMRNILEYIAISLILLIFGYTNLSPNLRIILCILATTFYYCRHYSVKKIKAIIISTFFWLSSIIVSGLSISIILLMTTMDSIADILSNTPCRIAATLIGMTLMTLSTYFFRLIFSDRHMKISDIIFVLFPMLVNVLSLLVACGMMSFTNTISSTYKLIYLSFTLMLFISNMSLSLGLNIVRKKNRDYIVVKSEKEKLKLEYMYYKNILATHESNKKLYHDMKNHLICIRGLYCNSNDKGNEYINNLERQIELNNINYNTGNEILNIKLYKKKKICLEKNIDFKRVINFKSCEFIDNIDVCTIFSNLLDNAIVLVKQNCNTLV